MPKATIYISDDRLDAWKRLTDAARSVRMGIGEYAIALFENHDPQSIPGRISSIDLELRLRKIEAFIFPPRDTTGNCT